MFDILKFAFKVIVVTFGFANYWKPIEYVAKSNCAKFERSPSQCAPSKNRKPQNPNYANMTTWAAVRESG